MSNSTKVSIFFATCMALICINFTIGWCILNYHPHMLQPINSEVITTKYNKFVTDAKGTKVVIYHSPLVKDMPENERFKNTIFFVQDGSAVLLNLDSLNYNIGEDVVWKSNGKWYGVLKDKNIDPASIRFINYNTPEQCHCVPITLMDEK